VSYVIKPFDFKDIIFMLGNIRMSGIERTGIDAPGFEE